MLSALCKWKNMEYVFTIWKEEECCPWVSAEEETFSYEEQCEKILNVLTVSLTSLNV